MDYVFDNREYLLSIDKNISNLISFSDKFDKKISDINNNISAFKSSFNTYSEYVKDKLMWIEVSIRDCSMYLAQIRDYFSKLTEWYYPQSGIAYPNQYNYTEMRGGWRAFFTSFAGKSFQAVLLDVHQKIEDKVNPLSEKNKGEFDNNIEKLKSDTVYGSALELKDGMQTFYSNISGASPTASLDVNLLPVKFYGASLPAKKITIDFSWFAPYRDTTLSLWRFFLWVGYIFIVFKRFPDILSGAGLITDTSTNGNMTEGIENSFYNITMDDDGNILSATESHTYKEGNNTYRYNVRKDVSVSSSTDIVKR
ncbi:hypothetical protein [Eubacterium sp.]